ncbi:MAG: cadherin domain-containing protein, partial [Pseudomonadales bacterium]|nr:cadherin domain-containing protein [Pseudomonadales bacterium]
MKFLLVPLCFCLCSSAFAQLSMGEQQYLIDENSANNTLVGQVIATGGQGSLPLQIDVGTQTLNNWSTRGEDYESVSFNTTFDSAPIVFRQLQSNGNYNVNYSVKTYSHTGSLTKKGYEVLFRTRQQNTSATGFDAILETNLWVGGSSSLTSIDSITGSESLGWLAFSAAATGSWNELAFEVAQTDSVITQANSTISFNGPFYEVPQFFSNVITSNDTNQVGVGIEFLQENKVKLYMDEIDDGDHNAEAVSLLMLQGSGSLTDASGQVIGETGTLSFSDTNRDSARTVSFDSQFSNPVVFVHAIGTDDEIYDAAFRFTNVGGDHFSGYLHDDYEYRAWAKHGNFDLHYVVLEAGSWQLGIKNYSYAISAGNDSGAFKVDADTGEIYVADSGQLDYESGIKQYVLTLNVNDGSNDLSTTVTININNVADSLNSDAQALEGLSSNDWSGWVVDTAGDVNGDGFDDVLIGVPQDDENGSNAGRVYVLFGNASGQLATFSALNDDDTNNIIDSANGFIINGAVAGDKAGFAVAGGGDVNGDGLADILVGAPYASPNGDESGTAYVVFGKTDSKVVELADIALDDNEQGFAMLGAYKYDHVGGTAIMGDVDGDGLADLILGEVSARNINPGLSVSQSTHSDPNLAYIVFGQNGGASIDLSLLADSDDDSGFVVRSKNRTLVDIWNFGAKVLPVGDVNSDGLLDFIVNTGFMGSSLGINMLIFGKTGGGLINYNTGNAGNNGLIISPEEGEYGYSMGSAGIYFHAAPDFITSKIGAVNGDGIDDMALLATDDSCCSNIDGPKAYIIFGGTDISDINLSDIANSVGGYVIYNDHSQQVFDDDDLIFGAIGGAGDVNGDGFDDLMIGDIFADDGNGRIYVIYGQAETQALYLSDIAIGQGGF